MSVVATMVATNYVARLDNYLGIRPGINPAAWVVLASGLFGTLVLFAVGTLLHLMCVVYDRQDHPFRASTANLKLPPGGKPKNLNRRTSSQPNEPPAAAAKPREPATNIGSATSEESNPHPCAGVDETSAEYAARVKSKLWQHLTKERHAFGA